MKITVSKVSAIVFTLVAVTAFSWMTLRPKAERHATGFALASNNTKTTTTTTTAPNTTQETTTNTDNTTIEAAVSTPDASTADQNTAKTDTTDSKKDKNSADETTATTTNDTPEKDTEANEAPRIEKTLTTEPPEAPNTPNEKQQSAEPTATNTPATDTNNTEEQDAEKKKTDNDIINQTTENAVETPQAQAIATTESTAPATDTTPQAPQTLNNTDGADADTNPSNTAPQSEPIVSTEEKPTEKTSAPIDPNTPKTSDLNNANTPTTPETTATIAPVAATALTPIAQKKPAENTATATAFYIPAETPRGTVIMLHGCDNNPTTADNLIQTLRKHLPTQGWNTLTFPLPALSTTSTYKDLGKVMPTVATLIEKNIADTKAKNQLPIVLLAHSCGSQMALAWIEKKGSDSIDAYIGIGTGIMNTALDTAGHLSKPIESMKFPQLDIFGSADNETVIKTAPERLAPINRAANPASRQKIILDADHNMTGKGELVSKVISRWLNRKAFR